jgi:hypothetical protein
MIRHIVFFKCKNAKDRDTVYEGLNLLTGIQDCVHIEVGVNRHLDALCPDAPDLIVYGLFDSEVQLETFKAHPLYKESIARVRPLRDTRVAADFYTTTTP